MASDDPGWAEAVRREALIRSLAERPRCPRAALGRAAAELGLSRSQTLALVQAFRTDPVTASLVRRRPGVKPGTRRLLPAVEAYVDEAYRAVFLAPERPSVAALVLEGVTARK